MKDDERHAPIRPLIVASWYPAIDDAAKGRFVADQVTALAATDRARPAVASFDSLPLVGGATARAHQAATIERRLRDALAAGAHPFAPRAFAVDAAAPVARLPIADGTIPGPGGASAEYHRSRALIALAERLIESDHRPTLIHAHTGYPDGTAAATMATRLGCPLVITEHATFLDRILAHPIQRSRYAAGAAAAARIVAVSQLLAERIRSALPEIEDKVLVIPNAIAVDDFRPVASADRDPDELLYVGYRTPIKGIDTLLAAFALVHAARPATRLRLIGRSTTPELERSWHRLAAESGVADAVMFDDVTDRAGVVAAMSRAAVLVHASRYETFGVVVAEALAAGLPVVATDSGGVREILGPDPEAFGGFVAADDPAAFAAAVIATLGRRATFEPESLRASIVERFSSTAVAARLLSLYDEVLAEAASTRTSGAPAESSGSVRSSARKLDWPSSEHVGVPRTVVGLDRGRAAQSLAALPRDLRQSLTVVTAAEPRTTTVVDVGRLVELAVDRVPQPPAMRRSTGHPTIDRFIRMASDPIGTVRRRRAGDPIDTRQIAILAERVREAVGDGQGPWLPLDGRDALVVAALEATLPSSSGDSQFGLRELADRWWSGSSALAGGTPDDQPVSSRTNVR